MFTAISRLHLMFIVFSLLYVTDTFRTHPVTRERAPSRARTRVHVEVAFSACCSPEQSKRPDATANLLKAEQLFSGNNSKSAVSALSSKRGIRKTSAFPQAVLRLRGGVV